MGAMKIFRTPWLRPRLLFPICFMGFCSDRPMNVPTKFEVVALPVPEIIGGAPKTGQSMDMPMLPFLQKILMGFYLDWPCKCTPKFKIFGTPWLRPRLLFPICFMGFCSDRPKNVPTKFEVVALPVPEIIGGTPQNWAVHGYAHAPFSPKNLMGFYSDWPCKCTPKFEVRSFTCSWDKRG